MKRKVFNQIYMAALEESDHDRFIAEWGSSSLVLPDPDTDVDFDKITNDLDMAWNIAHMPPRELISKSGLSQYAFSRRYCIKKRTLDHWISGQNQMPPHTRYMIAELLGLIEVEDDA